MEPPGSSTSVGDDRDFDEDDDHEFVYHLNTRMINNLCFITIRAPVKRLRNYICEDLRVYLERLED